VGKTAGHGRRIPVGTKVEMPRIINITTASHQYHFILATPLNISRNVPIKAFAFKENECYSLYLLVLASEMHRSIWLGRRATSKRDSRAGGI
jgi:hypothetical protein